MISRTLRRCLVALIALALLATMVMVGPPAPVYAQTTVPFTAISFGETWSYLDDGSDQGTAWRSANYDDSFWAAGPAQLGYGDGDEATVIGYGPDPDNKYPTTYFRRQFTAPPGVETLQLSIVRDDAFAVYINGVRAARQNLPNPHDYLSYATNKPNSTIEAEPVVVALDPAIVRPGANVIAVEIHQHNASSSDVSFDLELTGTATTDLVEGFAAISFGDEWSYLDDGSDQGTAWVDPAFDDASWPSAPSELGYGDGDEATTIGFGANPDDKYPTTYFRRTFEAPANVQTLTLSLVRDDGFVVYINGQRAARQHLPNPYDYQSYASAKPNSAIESVPVAVALDAALVHEGTNTIAVEMHQSSATSTDLSFNLQLTGTALTAAVDNEPPTVPGGLNATEVSASTATLQWAASTDNVGVDMYRIYRDGVLAGSVASTSTTFVDADLMASTTYFYSVSAVDRVGNESSQSNSAITTTAERTRLNLSRKPDVAWQTNGIVYTILPVGDTVYIGGEFTELHDGAGTAISRNNAAALVIATGEPTSFNPDLNNKVFAFTTSPDESTLYVGGSFTSAGGETRKRIAAYDRTTGTLTDFAPPFPNKSVRALGVDGNRLFVGGLFDEVGGEQRNRLAAYDVVTGTLDPVWRPRASNDVKTLIVDPDKVWIGGNFGRINGDIVTGLGIVDLVTGARLPSESPGRPIIDMAPLGDQMFMAAAGSGGGRGFAYDRATGDLQWTVTVDGNVQGVAAIGEDAYFGGHYATADGATVGRLTRHDAATGELDSSWLPFVNGSRAANDVASLGATIFIGGDFTTVSGEGRIGFAQFTDTERAQLPPELETITMLDTDANGFVDEVEVVFDQPLAACTQCLGGWSLVNVPSGGTLQSVALNGEIATLTITEGPGEPKTAVGGFRVGLDATSQLRGTNGQLAAFPEQAPLDGAAPVVTNLYRTNASTLGVAEAGDTITIRLSEPIDETSVPAETTVSIFDLEAAATDELTIPGMIDGVIDLAVDDYLTCDADPCVGDRQVDFVASPLTVSVSRKAVTVQLGSCVGDCDQLTPGSTTTLTVGPSPAIADLAGNSASAVFTRTLQLF